MQWTHNGKIIKSHDDFSECVIGFIYLLTYSNGKYYVGRKLIRSLVRVKPTKAMLAKRKNAVRMERKNKPFINYEGSSKSTEGFTIVKKEIIELCSDKINLTYCEQKHLMRLDVLCDDTYVNDCIGGKFYYGKIDKGL